MPTQNKPAPRKNAGRASTGDGYLNSPAKDRRAARQGKLSERLTRRQSTDEANR